MIKGNGGTYGVLQLLFRIGKRMPFLTALWLTVPIATGMLVVPLMTSQKHMIDMAAAALTGSGEDLAASVAPMVLLFIGVSVLQVLGGALRKVTDEMMNRRAEGYVQSEIFTVATGVSLERFEQPAFYDRLYRAQSAAGGELIGMLRNGVDAAQRIAQLAGLALVAAQAHWTAALILVLMNGTILYFRLKLELARRRLDKQLTAEGRMSDEMMKRLTDTAVLKEAKLFGSADYLLGQWAANTKAQRSRRFAMGRKENKMAAWVSLVHIAGAFLTLGVLLLLPSPAGTVSPGIVAVVFQAIFQSQGATLTLSWPLSKMIMQSGKAEELAAFLNEKGDRQGGSSPHRLTVEPVREVRLEQVSYRYPNAAKETLHAIDVTIRAGETIALVGDNGAGKSTLLKVLLGLYKPSAGRVRWNDADIAEEPHACEAVWGRVSAVLQENERYPFRLRDHVTLGSGRRAVPCDDREIKQVLEAVGLGGLIGDSSALDAPLGQLSEGGRELSGGQWQRLAIARAMLRGGELIVLDEPTAAIDPANEAELFRQFRRLSGGKTSIVISHRLGWARYADRILVLDQGRLLEDGTHEQLMSLNGKYAALFTEQAYWYRNEDDSEASKAAY
ncbi:putative multidrug resistance ABC transporter ATP-binding/permease protein YheI [Paenibacillus konkukensis]|uniref:Multidrug resistance ABC transporter ATP-binding/permease protein YheI n=1 Tax=Paenibacillus konkukensis TaxID=2020716 RepID=A0ABY4S0J8_9BACL|nr:ABC transporter ATP-binding protein [Paenibacillus konkukensis]UQZ87460.1 putative multidrug resistance ABC transporter ATP-binding/permease protein YheI [Paenibacillus konkukensis]